ncbi:lipopolysaccharide biosynthesis protein [Cryobacterium sp. TMB1-7]|uniref:lipopolysaccharide biosynthesis protein n=1 Tax=Cryobacterium sp. TMB1-7 TaxID=2555866 RepID=UPI00106C75DE|nr:polysaccharide biosynthesis C-terminal domain-containing protein [Cryobacterium sp. TMB1-7]TFC61637.1 hypothetical protein E3O60_03550 [Cryobacterium sp. TMB1-7]
MKRVLGSRTSLGDRNQIDEARRLEGSIEPSLVSRRLRGLTSQAIQVTIVLAISQLLVAVAYAIGARATLPSALGISLSAIAIASVAAALVDFGLSAFLIREVASGRCDNAAMYSRLWQRLLLAGLVGTVLFTGGLLVLISIAADWGFLLWVGLIFASSLLLQTAQVPLRAHGMLGLISIATVLDRLIFLSSTWALILLGVGGELAIPLGLAAGMGFDSAFCFVLNIRKIPSGLKPSGRVRVGPPSLWFTAWRGTRGYGIAAVLGSAQQLDVTILGFSGGAAAAGAYGAVSRWTTPLLLPSTALTQVGMAHAPKANSTRLALRGLRRVAWILVLAVMASLFVAGFAGTIAPAILGTQYDDSSAIFTVLALSIIPTLFAQPLSMVLQSRGREGKVAWILGLGLFLRLITCLILGAQLGGLAAAWAVTIQQAAILLILVALVLRVLDIERKSERAED